MSIRLFNVPIDQVSEHQLDTLLRLWIKDHAQKMIVTPNPEMLLAARRDPSFLQVLQSSHLALPDGVGLRFAAAALTDYPLRHRHTGVDTLERLAQICEDYGKRLVLLGGRGESGRRTAIMLRDQFPDLDVVALDPGNVTVTETTTQIDPDAFLELSRLKPVVLAVAFGAGKQESFIHEHLGLLPTVTLAIGVGGALNMMSGELSRAPGFLRRTGFEWVWRVLREPSRIGRIMRATVVFPLIVAYDSLIEKRFLKALTRVAPEVARQLIGK